MCTRRTVSYILVAAIFVLITSTIARADREQYRHEFLNPPGTSVTEGTAYFAIVGSHLTRDDAEAQLRRILDGFPDLDGEVYKPYQDSQFWAVMLATFTSRTKAQKVVKFAKACGIKDDAYVWNFDLSYWGIEEVQVSTSSDSLPTNCVQADQPASEIAGRIWYEQGIATLTVGYDADIGAFRHRKIYFVSYGPESLPGSSHDMARECTAVATTAAGEDLRDRLGKIKYPELPEPGEPALTTAQLNEAARVRYKKLDSALVWAVSAVGSKLSDCSGGRLDDDGFSAGLIMRECDLGACGNVQNSFAGHPAARAFSSITEWVRTRDEESEWGVNTLVVFSSGPAQEEFVEDFTDSNAWPEERALEQSQIAFESAVAKLRESGQRFEYSVPRSIGLPREIALRALDLFDDPVAATISLRSQPDAPLYSISDELARTRLIECTRFRGKTSISDLETCSGYHLNDTVRTQCLSGGKCVPEINERASLWAILITRPMGFQELANEQLVPRLKLVKDGEKVEDVYTAVTTCAENNRGSREATAECVVADRLGSNERKALECYRQYQQSASAIECASGNLPDEAKATLDCIRNTDDARSATVCAVTPSFPKEVSYYVECQDEYQDSSEIAACVAFKMAADSSDSRIACLSAASQGDWAKGLACIVQEDQLPPEARPVISCLQSSNSEAGFAVCAVEEKLPAKYRRPARCIAESNGDPFGTGICMVSDKLTPEQRIALQCAASSGGEPVTFAGCTTGRLIQKEMIQCADDKFGERDCFGKNNEFRKLSRQWLGVDIGPNSFVAAHANVPLDYFKWQIAVNKSLLEGGEQAFDDIGKEFKRAGQNIGGGVESAGREIAKAGGKTIKWGKKTGGKVKKELGKIFGCC